MKIDILSMDMVLDYCDGAQLFVGRDSFGTSYLCLLFSDEPAAKYTAIRISKKRIDSFLAGTLDLREIFLNPETPQEYYDVLTESGSLVLERSSLKSLPEERLPEAGYRIPSDKEESLTVRIPMRDHDFIHDLARKLGWVFL